MLITRRKAEPISRTVVVDGEEITITSDLTRNFEDITNCDVINIKQKLKELFNEDPDLLNMLGKLERKPLNKYQDEENPTEEELKTRREIIEYNDKVDSEEQLIPWIKVNPTQTTVKNHLMYDVRTERRSYDNSAYKSLYIDVCVLINENDMMTEYGIPRADLVGYIVKDLIHQTQIFGCHPELAVDEYQVVDGSYYWRRMCFYIDAPNHMPGHTGVLNKYDRFGQFAD